MSTLRHYALASLLLVVAAVATATTVPAANAAPAGWAPSAMRALASTDAVAASLRQSPVYNDPDAERALSPSDEVALLAEVQGAGTPIYVAVVPKSFIASAGGSADAALQSLARAVGQPGAYALIAGGTFRANSTLFPVNDLATKAVAANQGGTSYSVLSQFVASVSERAAAGGSSSDTTSGAGDGGFDLGGILVLLVGLGAVGGAVTYSVRKSRRRTAEQFAAVKGVVDEDVTSFGEQVAAFDITDRRLDDAGRSDLESAITSYQQASSAADTMTTAGQAADVTTHLEDGRFAMACVQSRLAGQPLPARRAPCFFDPRHGPSAANVNWSPPGGTQREVPACVSCYTTAAQGAIPASRQVPVGAGTQPYWQAGPSYGSYAGGYFQSYGSILPQIMVGTMLGNALFPPVVVSGGGDGGSGGDGGGFGGFGGSSGGGDFGGGGGGDFSGGSGGGDF